MNETLNKILIFGGNGVLGNELKKYCDNKKLLFFLRQKKNVIY